MRNSQLIRQWKILKYIANGDFCVLELNLPELQEVFGKCHKTIRRDIHGLLEAGFLTEYRFNNKSKVVAKRKKLSTEKYLKDTVFDIAMMSNREIAALDLLRCNSCTYVFKTKNGRIDMQDFRIHKRQHQ